MSKLGAYRVGIYYPGETGEDRWTGSEIHIFVAFGKKHAVSKFRDLFRGKKKHSAVEGEIIVAERIPKSQIFS